MTHAWGIRRMGAWSRPLLSEALIIALVGGATGVLLAWIGTPLIVRAAPEVIPRIGEADIDPGTLLFTALVVIVAAVGAGILPALKFSSPDVIGGLRSGDRTGSVRNPLTRNSLVVVQTAAALVLLVGSGLLLQSFRALRSVDPGYDIHDIFTFQMAPDPEEYGLSDGPSMARFHYGFMDRLAALPGVESVGLVNTLPLDEGAGEVRVRTSGYDGPPENAPRVRLTFADGGYFETMGIQFLAGEEPLGQVIRPAGAPDAFPWITVGGVVEDVILADFRQQTPEPLIYLPMVGPTARAWGVGTPAYVVRSPRADRLAPKIRALIQEVAPGAPMYRVFTMEQLADRSMARLSFTMLALFSAAALALVLGSIGIYGTISYVVSRRTREIGIRMALGASSEGVRRMIVMQGGRVALVGIALGLVAAWVSARSLESLLFEVTAHDPLVFAAVAMVVLAVALAASYVPARRASAVDPVQAIRTD